MSAETWPESAEQERAALEASPLPPLAAGMSDLERLAVHGDDGRICVDSSAGELTELVREHGCLRTLTTGPRDGELAVAVAGVHAHRNEGVHTVIDSDRMPPELALPQLLGEGTQLDFALIEGPRAFEDAFLEFLYLDRMLATGGLLALGGMQHGVVITLVQYVAGARAYELRSAPGAALTVLRKLGRHRSQSPPAPQSWRRAGDPLAPSAGSFAPIAFPARADAHAGNGAASREDFLARAGAADLEARARELSTRLLQAEAESVRELAELRHQLDVSEAAREQAEYWLARITSSVSWRLTSPLRALKKHSRSSGR